MGLIHPQQWLKPWLSSAKSKLTEFRWGRHCLFFEWYWLCLNVAALFVDLFVGSLLCVCDPDGAAPVAHVHSSSVPSAPSAPCATATRPAATQNYQPPWCLKPSCHNEGGVNFWYFWFHVLKFVLCLSYISVPDIFASKGEYNECTLEGVYPTSTRWFLPVSDRLGQVWTNTLKLCLGLN